MIEIIIVAGLALVILGFGALLSWMKRQINALKSAVEIQEHTILAQADRMNAQGEVLRNVEEVHRLMKTVLDILDAPAMVKRWEDYRALVDQAREQLARVEQQDVNEVTTTMGGLVELVSSLILYTPSSQRQHVVEATSLPSFLKEHLHRLAAAAPDRSTLTLTVPQVEHRSSPSNSTFSPAQAPRLPAMPSPSPVAEEHQAQSHDEPPSQRHDPG
jgi:hypothetical protein